jgi:hypothetical protein
VPFRQNELPAGENLDSLGMLDIQEVLHLHGHRNIVVFFLDIHRSYHDIVHSLNTLILH